MLGRVSVICGLQSQINHIVTFFIVVVI